MEDFFIELFKSHSYKKKENPQLMPVLTLAFIGDSLFDVAIRTLAILEHEQMQVNKLHLLCSQRAKASAQAQAAKKIFDQLEKDEQDIYIRASNTKFNTIPKNATLNDYRYATALEAVIGYCYMSENYSRMKDIILLAIDNQEIKPVQTFKPLKSFK